jgi:hypothetical protein
MIRASHDSNGDGGSPLPVAMYLAQRYGLAAGVDLRSHAGEQFVPDELWTHRTMMFERHLAWPIRLS